MSQSTSKSAGPKKRRRTFTKRFYAKAVAHYRENGWKATADKFRISGSAMQKVKTMSTGEAEAPPAERTGRSLYLAAKALERALMRHRKAGSPPSDIEHYAFFLLREILKDDKNQ